MIAVTVRYPGDIVAAVHRRAKQAGVSEAMIWREIVNIGLYNKQVQDGTLGTVRDLTMQTLCLTRRVAGHIDESLIDKARENYRRTMESWRES